MHRHKKTLFAPKSDQVVEAHIVKTNVCIKIKYKRAPRGIEYIRSSKMLPKKSHILTTLHKALSRLKVSTEIFLKNWLLCSESFK